MTKKITSFEKKYDFLSNFYPSVIMMDGYPYNTVEHFYQASKARNTNAHHFINLSPTPGIAKRRGADVELVDDWEAKRYDIMLAGVRAKFTQNFYLVEDLVATGDAVLVEGNHWHDNYWGDCGCDRCADIVGENNLGKILMQVRSEFVPVKMPTSKKLEILKQSLIKKEAKLDELLRIHFRTVEEANGQPLNDKRGGEATLAKWDAQSDAIRNQQAEIEKTRAAIADEELKLDDVASWYKKMPKVITDLIDAGTLVQWRRYPHIMFVTGVDKARIVFDGKTGGIAHKYVGQIHDKAQYAIFRDVYNGIREAWGK